MIAVLVGHRYCYLHVGFETKYEGAHYVDVESRKRNNFLSGLEKYC